MKQNNNNLLTLYNFGSNIQRRQNRFSGSGEHNYNVEIRRGNCLAVLITPNGEGGMFLYSFFADRQHLVNIQKHYGKVIFDEVVDCRLNMRHKESKTLLEFFVKSFDVICYYE